MCTNKSTKRPSPIRQDPVLYVVNFSQLIAQCDHQSVLSEKDFIDCHMCNFTGHRFELKSHEVRILKLFTKELFM